MIGGVEDFRFHLDRSGQVFSDHIGAVLQKNIDVLQLVAVREAVEDLGEIIEALLHGADNGQCRGQASVQIAQCSLRSGQAVAQAAQLAVSPVQGILCLGDGLPGRCDGLIDILIQFTAHILTDAGGFVLHCVQLGKDVIDHFLHFRPVGFIRLLQGIQLVEDLADLIREFPESGGQFLHSQVRQSLRDTVRGLLHPRDQSDPVVQLLLDESVVGVHIVSDAGEFLFQRSRVIGDRLTQGLQSL